MMTSIRFARCFFASLLVFFLIHCGGVRVATSAADPSLSDTSNTASTVGAIHLFATDFQSPGLLYKAQIKNGLLQLLSTGVSPLGTEAQLGFHNDLLFVLHASGNFNSVSTDNLQIINPYDSSFPYRTLKQFSLGNGANPVATSFYNNSALISLYNPNMVPALDVNQGTTDVIRIDYQTGSIEAQYSFHDFLDPDGDKQANAFCSVVVGSRLYVCLQDLQTGTYKPVSSGKIGVIDLNTNQILHVIELTGRNPFDLAVSEDEQYLYVTCIDQFKTSSDFGGLEIIDLNQQDSIAFIDDEFFGGYVEKVRVYKNNLYIVVSRQNLNSFVFESRIAQISESDWQGAQISSFLNFGDDIRAITVSDNILWVAKRTISTSTGGTGAALSAYNLDTGSNLGSSSLPAAAISLFPVE